MQNADLVCAHVQMTMTMSTATTSTRSMGAATTVMGMAAFTTREAPQLLLQPPLAGTAAALLLLWLPQLP